MARKHRFTQKQRYRLQGAITVTIIGVLLGTGYFWLTNSESVTAKWQEWIDKEPKDIEIIEEKPVEKPKTAEVTKPAQKQKEEPIEQPEDEKKEDSEKIEEPVESITEEEVEKEEFTNQEELTKTYKTPNYEVSYPEVLTPQKVTETRVAFIEAGQQTDTFFEGNIVVDAIPNPEGIKVAERYNGTNDINLFADALGGAEPITVNGINGFKFSDVIGATSSTTVVVLNNGNQFIEITGVNEAYVSNGLYDAIVNSVQLKK